MVQLIEVIKKCALPIATLAYIGNGARNLAR